MNIGVEKHKTKVLKRVLYPVWEERVTFGTKAPGSHARQCGVPGPRSSDGVLVVKPVNVVVVVVFSVQLLWHTTGGMLRILPQQGSVFCCSVA